MAAWRCTEEMGVPRAPHLELLLLRLFLRGPPVLLEGFEVTEEPAVLRVVEEAEGPARVHLESNQSNHIKPRDGAAEQT